MPPLHFLAVIRRRLRLIVAGEALSRILALLACFFLAVAILDTVNALPSWLRLGLWLVGLSLLGIVVWRRALRPLGHDMGLPVIAGLVERRRPAFNGRLFAAVDGLALSSAEQADLDACCASHPPAGLVRSQPLRRSLALALALALTIATAGLLWPQWLGTAAGRVFMPWSQAYQHPRRCMIEAALVDTVVADDQSLMVEVRALRGGPDLLQISWQDAVGQRGEHRAGSLTGPWRERLDLDLGSYHIDVRYGDSLPVRLSARVVPRPRLTDIAVTLSPPPYTGFDAEDLGAPAAVMALPGSTISAAFSTAPHPAAGDQTVRVRYGDQTVAVEPGPTANSWHFTLPINDGGDIHIDLIDHHVGPVGDSIAIAAEPPLRLPVTLAEDARPRISLDGPRRNETVGVNAEIDLRLEARDDIGLASLRLVRQLRSDDEDRLPDILHELTIPRLDGRLLREISERYRVTVSSLAAVGDEIVLIAEAEDANDITGPGIGHSDPLALRVIGQEALRQELDRLLGDARDRLALARDQLATGLGDDEQTTPAARNARSVTRRADEYLQQVARRWRQNQLEEARMQTIDTVAELVERDVLDALGAAADGRQDAGDQAMAADRALAEAERLLSGMLQIGDLAETLARLIERQNRLGEDSAAFVLHYARGELDGPGRSRRGHLGERQQDLGRQLGDWQQRLLATTQDSFSPARELTRQRQPAALLDQAARIIVRDSERRLALERQQEGLAVMEELLRLLRGSEDRQNLANAAADLARRQEELHRQLGEGLPPGGLRRPQDTLREDTDDFGERLGDTDDDEAQDALQQALSAQRRAAEAMAAGSRSDAERETSRAAEELRRLEQALGGEDQAADDDDSATPDDDVLTILARLRERQQDVVRQAEVLRRDQDPDADDALGFAARRRLRSLVDEEEDIHLILRQDILATLEDAPLARRAFSRLDGALERAVAHLGRPALGERGVRLVTIVLFEMDRLLDIVASLPPPQEEDGDGPDGDGQQAEQQELFPARAQLALLLAEQRELRALTAAAVPVDQAASQAELRDLMEALLNAIRPGSRPQILMQRAFRAAASAAWELAEGGRRDHTLNEQDAAISALQRILEEATAQRSQAQQQEEAQARPADEEPEQPGRPQDEADETEAQADSQTEADSDPDEGPRQAMTGDPDGVRVRTGETGEGWLMRLPPQMRRPLDEARRRNLPPEGILLYRRFLELLLEDE